MHQLTSVPVATKRNLIALPGHGVYPLLNTLYIVTSALEVCCINRRCATLCVRAL